METLLTIAQRGDLPVRSDCGGRGKCGKCVVSATPAEHMSGHTPLELDSMPTHLLAKNHRLACQARILGPLTVRIPRQSMDSADADGKEIPSVAYPVNPLVRRIQVPGTASPARRSTDGDLLSGFSRQLRNACGHETPPLSIEVLRQLSRPPLPGKDLTVVFHKDLGVTAILEQTPSKSLGLAVDIGTTTLAAYLCDFSTGRVIAAASAANPQRQFGDDVISRIAHAGKDVKNLDALRRLSSGAVSDLAAECVGTASARLEDIDEVTIVGNPTMQQLFYGGHPHSLGTSPFLPLTRQAVQLKASDAGLPLNSGTPVYIFPVVSGFVGGDTIAALLADKPYLRDEMSLIVDIGTNGELVAGDRDGLWAASCATGPAFEGAHISHGMRATRGAVSRVEMDGGSIRCTVIGEESGSKPMGLCGSGVIDAIAGLRRAGILLENGSFQKNAPGVRCDDQGIGREFILVPGEKSGTGSPISITLGDIRQIQLAKAALAVGISHLVRHAGKKVKRTVLTGAFGARFNWHNAAAIGMLPSCAVSGEVIAMDNLAGVGAILALLDENARREIDAFQPGIRHLDLARAPDFHKDLMRHMAFPPVL